MTSRVDMVALVLCGAMGCTTYSTFKSAGPIDCTVENAYEFQDIDTFETLTTPPSSPFWTSADCTAGASITDFERTLPDGARCGSTIAVEIQAVRNDDWGGVLGFNNFGPRDASAFEGISFWARSPGGTTKGFTVSLDDPNTYANPSAIPPIPGNCTVYPTTSMPDGGTDAGCGTTTSGVIIDPATGMVLSSGTATAPPPANACGNQYALTMAVTSDWQLYTIPFSRFQQAAMPSRVPNAALTQVGTAPGTALITSQLMNLNVRLPKEAVMDLWIDNLAFYRAKESAPGDGGVDAPRM